VLWAFAKLGVLNEPLLAAGVQYGLRHMATFAPQSVSNMTWAYATLGFHPGRRWVRAAAGRGRRLARLAPCCCVLLPGWCCVPG
jgi:hypothetical protein